MRYGNGLKIVGIIFLKKWASSKMIE